MTRERETFGNIPPLAQTVFYFVAVAAMGIFAYGVYRRLRLWRQGEPIQVRELLVGNCRQVLAKLRPGARRLLVDGLGQKRVFGRGPAGVAHVGMFAGFMVLLLGTTLLEINHLAVMVSRSLKFHRGTYYLIYNFTLDVFGLLFLCGVLFFFCRRLNRPRSAGHRGTDWYVLASFLVIGASGYVLEGLRIVWDHPVGVWAQCSPVGLRVASLFRGLSDLSARKAHFALWWFHALAVFGFIASIPYTRLFHLVAGPANLFFTQGGLGRLKPISAEEVEATGRVGVSDIRHFTQQQLLSLDACMECGRCEEACPAFATGKPLSPKKVVIDLRTHMTATLGRKAPHVASRKLHGEVIAAETLWSCTACSACVNVCPVRIDQLGLIIDLRRHRVAEGGLGGTEATALRRMQSAGNPWGLPADTRTEWTVALVGSGAAALASGTPAGGEQNN